MNNLPPNPFRFGDPVQGDYYLQRIEMENLVAQFLKNRIHVVLIGPRRMGKTSFLLNLLQKLHRESHPYVYVDIFNITSHRDFLHQLMRALRGKKSWGNRIKSLIGTVQKLRPKLSTQVDSTGNPSLDFSLDLAGMSENDVKEAIQDVLTSLAGLGEGLVFAIDEFQKVTEIDDKGWLEATLRIHMQQLTNTSFIFTGSRRSVIYDMLNNPTRPLYKFCQPIEFPTFGHEFSNWIVARFAKVGIQCDYDAIEYLRKLVHDSPNYTQMVCFLLVAEGKMKISVSEVDAALKKVVRQNAYAFQTLLSTLSTTQQRTLRLAAIEGKQIFSKELLSKYEIASSAALSSSIKALKEKEILDEDGGGKGIVIFDDPLFAIWLKDAFLD